ncbi:MAG: helix-turn-helix transcriptional regulator [bacterium]|nr:helix-turn-helix transcriptional regulator [bacterium]
MKRQRLCPGDGIKKVRKSLGYSGTGMASTLDMPRSSYYRLENGSTTPDLITQAKLAHTMGVSLDWLVLNRGEMFYKKPVSKGKDSTTAGLVEALGREVTEMLEHMKKIPLLHHELLVVYHKFKVERPTLVEKSMNLPD